MVARVRRKTGGPRRIGAGHKKRYYIGDAAADIYSGLRNRAAVKTSSNFVQF